MLCAESQTCITAVPLFALRSSAHRLCPSRRRFGAVKEGRRCGGRGRPWGYSMPDFVGRTARVRGWSVSGRVRPRLGGWPCRAEQATASVLLEGVGQSGVLCPGVRARLPRGLCPRLPGTRDCGGAAGGSGLVRRAVRRTHAGPDARAGDRAGAVGQSAGLSSAVTGFGARRNARSEGEILYCNHRWCESQSICER